jgi:hypothetical protein
MLKHNLLKSPLHILLCVVAAACSGSKLPATAAVSGTVTYKGKPLPNAEISFIPEGGGRAASGRTDESGRFTLGTFSIDDGALIGKHRVSVSARGPDRPAKAGEGSGMPGGTVPGDPLIPMKYFSPVSSGLVQEVTSGTNRVELALTD